MVNGQVLLHEKYVRNMSHHENFVRKPRVVCWSAAPHHALPFCLNMCWQQYCTIDVHTNTYTAHTALKIQYFYVAHKTHQQSIFNSEEITSGSESVMEGTKRYTAVGSDHTESFWIPR